MVSKLLPPVFIPKSVTNETLAVPATQGKNILEPFKSAAAGSRTYLLEDCDVDNKCEVHRTEADLWTCLEGEVEFEVGGELVDPYERKHPDGSKDQFEVRSAPGNIRGAMKYTLRPGDLLFIPAGVPHAHRTQGTARLYFTKIPQPEVLLKDIPGWQGN